MSSLVVPRHLVAGNGEIGTNPPGTVAGSEVTVSEEAGVARKTVLTFTNRTIALTDEVGVIAYGGTKIYDFPEGVVFLFGALADLTITKDAAGVNDTWDGDFSLGTATAGNNANLGGSEANIIPSTATPQAVAGATTAKGVTDAQNKSTIHDGTTTPIDMFLNFLVDDADHNVAATPTNLVVNGTITFFWINKTDH